MGVGPEQISATVSATIYWVCITDQTCWGPQRLEGKDMTLPERGTPMRGGGRNSLRKENSVQGGEVPRSEVFSGEGGGVFFSREGVGGHADRQQVAFRRAEAWKAFLVPNMLICT